MTDREILMEIFTDAEFVDDDETWGYLISNAMMDKVREAVESDVRQPE